MTVPKGIGPDVREAISRAERALSKAMRRAAESATARAKLAGAEEREAIAEDEAREAIAAVAALASVKPEADESEHHTLAPGGE